MADPGKTKKPSPRSTANPRSASAPKASSVSTRSAQKRPTQAGRSLHSGQSIVPSKSIAGNALAAVIAIMGFLTCLTFGLLTLINQTANSWTSDISREVTVQIRPSDDREMADAVRSASRIILSYEGITKVTELDQSATERLLEPWLGSGLNLQELPVPRLLMVSTAEGARPDFQAISQRLKSEVPGTSLDDHRTWVDRLTNMAWTMVLVGATVFFLMMGATVLTVVFATRGAMASNKDVVEVLHFVGADGRFIANEFQRHFLILGLKGAMAGGVLAILLFLILGFWSSSQTATPQADQVQALFGTFTLGFWGYVGILGVVVLIAVLTALTSRLTVEKQVQVLHTYRQR